MKHDVTFTVPELKLGKQDLTFDVRVDGDILGTMKVSKGALVWRPRNCTNAHKVTWRQFDRMMQKTPNRADHS